MAKEKKIEVWMNGKKTKLPQDDTMPDEKYSIKAFNKEYAATVEDSDIPELIRQDRGDTDSNIYFTRKSRFRAFKPFLLAALSAIVIGSVLGFFMLNMFVDINNDISRQGDNSSLAAVDSEDDEKENDTGSENANSDLNGDEAATALSIDATSAFVLQAGKFGEKHNAEEMVSLFEQKGFPSMIWEKEDFFFVLSGISTSKDQGAQTANELEDKDLEVYVTEWHTQSAEIELPENEKEWLDMYEQQWNNALKSVSDGNQLSQEAWSEVIDKIPENTEYITKLADLLTEQHEQMGEAGIWQDQLILLSLWKQFGNLISQ